jgi:hypothetical protein
MRLGKNFRTSNTDLESSDDVLESDPERLSWIQIPTCPKSSGSGTQYWSHKYFNFKIFFQFLGIGTQ